MTKRLSKTEKARRLRRRVGERRERHDFHAAIDGLVKRAIEAALAITYHGIRGGNPEMSCDAAFDMAYDIMGQDYVIDATVDAAFAAACDEPDAKLAFGKATAAAALAALNIFTLRHKAPAGRA